jgi:hypothetical protein
VAHCNEGYHCDRCGEYVASVQESELYLRYVLGAVPLDELPREPERHILCAPEFAQFIVTDDFAPVVCDDPALDKRVLPVEVRARQERLFTRAWRRLQELRESGLAVDQYPLPPADLA